MIAKTKTSCPTRYFSERIRVVQPPRSTVFDIRSWAFALVAGSVSFGILAVAATPAVGSSLPPGSNESLSSVTCVSSTDCWAVGSYYRDLNSPSHTLIVRWNGTSWSIVPSPNTTPSQSNALNSVTCPSASECWAVGGVSTSPLIEKWNGTSWSIASSPNVNGTLNGVACNSAPDCWATGASFANSGVEPLVERWDGSSWSVFTSIFSSSAYMEGVTCTSATNCWAVGGASGGSTGLLRWDGTEWVLNQAANTLSTSVLFSVVCTSSSDCQAVGYRHSPGFMFPNQTLVQRYNGASWSDVASPNMNANAQFASNACTSSSNCWAVGVTSERQALIERWDGNAWTIASSPTLTHPNGLNAVACTSATDCWAVGSYTNTSGLSQGLFEHWDGNRWSVFSPTVPPLLNVVSRMVHGSAGTFDVDLPLTGTPGIECRRGGSNGNYSILFDFVNGVMNCGTTPTAGATVTPGPNSNQCTVNLTNVTNAHVMSIELDNVQDASNNGGNVIIPMGVLIGDTNGDGFVDAIDTTQTKSQSGSALTITNFREDVNADGFIDAIDVSLVKSKSGTALSSSPSMSKPRKPDRPRKEHEKE